MKATRFMRIPFFVQGYCVTEEDMQDIAKWCEGHVITTSAGSFIRVPVLRPTHKKQTEAYIGDWVIVSNSHKGLVYKVYTQEWLDKTFTALPDEPLVWDISADIEKPAPVEPIRPANVRPVPRPIPTQFRPTNHVRSATA